MSVLILDKEYEEYIQQKEEIERLNKAIRFINTEYDTYSSSQEWRKALIKILDGDVKDE